MSNNKPISEHGRIVARQKACSTQAKVEEAKRKIVAEIEKNMGIYPYAGGRVSAAEVLRRAGLDRALLQKPTHRGLRDELNTWVKAIKEKVRSGHKVVRKSVTKRAEAAEEKTDRIYQLWTEAELEYVEQARRLVDLHQKCSEMAQAIEDLRKQLDQRPI